MTAVTSVRSSLWLRTDVFTFIIQRLELTRFWIWWILISKLNIYSSVSTISISRPEGLQVPFCSAPWVSRLFLQCSKFVSVADVFHF